MGDPAIYVQVMSCGHAANSYRTINSINIPACVICNCITVADTQPALTGRKARCAYYGKAAPMTLRNRGVCPTRTKEDQTCRCEKPSKFNLWFFEYRGLGGSEEKHCAVCGFYAVAHELINPATGRSRSKAQAHKFVPRQPAEFDKFYCSCYGDD